MGNKIRSLLDGTSTWLTTARNHGSFFFGYGKEPSVFFFTFHKCASSLFSGYVLKNIQGLLHADFARQIRINNLPSEKVIFKNKGFIYGPIRLSADPESTVHEKLILPVNDPNFLKDKTALFLIRDPRDILVSGYYSYAFSHKLNSSWKARQKQKEIRKRLQEKTLDEYALEEADRLIKYFDLLESIRQHCAQQQLLRYEDMIDNFNLFSKHLTRYLKLSPYTLRNIYLKTRPRETEDIMAHKRSGKTQGFRSKLGKETIHELDIKFQKIYSRYNYQSCK